MNTPQVGSQEKPSQPHLLGQYAGLVTRLVAFVLDLIILSSVIVFVNWIIRASLFNLQFDNLIERVAKIAPTWGDLVGILASPITAGAISFLFVVLYHVFFWTIAGQTIGKAIMGIKIVPLNGRKMTLMRSIIRYAGYYPSGLVFGLGFLWILIDDKRSGWHDRLAGTCVVYAWDARMDETFLVEATENLESRKKLLRKFLSQKESPVIESPTTEIKNELASISSLSPEEKS